MAIASEATAAMDDEACLSLPTDLFVETLLRLPLCKRWRLRLVCRRWRDVIQERTPAPAPNQPVPLAFVVNYDTGHTTSTSAYIIDDQEKGRWKELWRSSSRVHDKGSFDTTMVGTCNGLLCLCDNTQTGGAVTMVNPVTKETLAVPPLPGSGQ
ncbi:hypothetical protein EJB05_48542, partial [Eragrostis curvula]